MTPTTISYNRDFVNPDFLMNSIGVAETITQVIYEEGSISVEFEGDAYPSSLSIQKLDYFFRNKGFTTRTKETITELIIEEVP